MTAEILIMNKTAVALAADSAVTFEPGEERKIFRTGNKLFALSKYRPVGIMVYGGTQLNEVPWETIVKRYRRNLGKKRFDRLTDYADHFVAFLGGDQVLFTEARQERFFRFEVHGLFRLILENINSEVASILEAQDRISDQEIEAVVDDKIEEHYHRTLDDATMLPSVDDAFGSAVIQKHLGAIEETKADVFQNLPVSEVGSERLKQLCGALFTRERFLGGQTGLVIAGFGDQDVFPAFVEIAIDGVLLNKANCRTVSQGAINENVLAFIKPFAQREMVVGFMTGIEPDPTTLFTGYLHNLVSEYPHEVANNLPQLDEGEKQALVENLVEFGQKVLEDVRQGIEGFVETKHIDPVTTAVASLPKDELASMAESLVNLTSFKRRVSMAEETVGGPIDVAAISKGDGFIWIKRKHYFEADLNPAFFANYFRDEQEEAE